MLDALDALALEGAASRELRRLALSIVGRER
jgi:hypothetical protein